MLHSLACRHALLAMLWLASVVPNLAHAQGPLSFIKTACLNLLQKTQRVLSEAGAWLPGAQQRFHNQINAEYGAAANDFDRQFAVLLNGPDPELTNLKSLINQWPNATEPARVTTPARMQMQYGALLGTFFSRTTGKFKQVFWNHGQDQLLLQIAAPHMYAGKPRIRLKLVFSSPETAALIGTLVQQALSLTTMNRGTDLPLYGGLWQLDYVKPLAPDPKNPLLEKTSQGALGCFAPLFSQPLPAIQFDLPIMREAKGYELFIAHLVRGFDYLANHPHKFKPDSEAPFSWHADLLDAPSHYAGFEEDAPQSLTQTALGGFSKHATFSGKSFYLLAETTLSTFVHLSETGQLARLPVQQHFLPAITQAAAARVTRARQAVSP